MRDAKAEFAELRRLEDERHEEYARMEAMLQQALDGQVAPSDYQECIAASGEKIAHLNKLILQQHGTFDKATGQIKTGGN